ncbi:MAG TPA: spore coat U domain-containing protein [Vicinamibacterales bacterium]|nr:spore coat U domain-containing protein [Vicinamibacterales bacterium]
MYCRPALRRALAILSGVALVGVSVAGAQGTSPKPSGGDRHCVVNSSGIDFGVYDTLDIAPTDATGSITYSCSQGGGALNVVVTIGRGLAGSFDRAMSNGQEHLGYNVYLDVGHTRIWGDGSSGTATLTDKVPGNDHPTTATVFGRLFPRQNVGSGRYVDSLVVTMQF